MIPQGLARYVDLMSELSLARIASLPDIVTDDIHFRDPFNDVIGRAHFARCLEDMVAQIADLRIEVTHAAQLHPLGGSGGATRHALYWRFGGRLVKLGGRRWDVTGVAIVTLAGDERVCEHLDYWDAAGGLYEQLPLFGGLMRWLRRRLAVA
jgi:steroid delta-isomerase